MTLITGQWLRGQDVTPPYKNPKLSAEQRTEDLLGRMTLDEKLAMMAGATWMESAPNARLGIPSLKMADGPVGVRSWSGPSAMTNAPGSKLPQVLSTAFPAGVALGATWDPEMLHQVGQALGQEVRALGRNMLLGPSINIHRTPWAGRNFETYGEDPYLTSRLVVGYIQGMQGEGVIATVKHFAANSQEFERRTIDEKIGERALHEIYLPGFKAAVEEAGVWSVMSAYNKVNGYWCSENSYLLRDTLKGRWGFKGFVVSDWGGTHGAVEDTLGGLDLEMPAPVYVQKLANHDETTRQRFTGGFHTPEALKKAIADGKVTQAEIDERVKRMLRVMFSSGIFDRTEAASGEVDTPAEIAVARAAAREGIVLLKNERAVLPLEAAKVHSIAVIGPSAAVARTGGGGSSNVRPKYAISPLEGMRARAGSQFQVHYALGVPMEGEEPGKDNAALIKEAAEVAATSDVALVFVGNSAKLERESEDRKTLGLPAGQDELIQAVAAANKNTVVVLIAGSPVLMDGWIGHVPAIVEAWYGGQEGGHAIADVLFGDANPSGKLPMTFLKRWEDSPAYGHYPGENGVVEYAEGMYVGYRYFDKRNLEPLFPFGHGLSYTTFAYSDLMVKPGMPVEVSLAVRNTGAREGAEVVQLYVKDTHSSADRPVKELKGFRRVILKPGETRTVSFSLDKSAMSYYSTAKHDWVAEPGTFEVLVGSSSRDIRLTGRFELKD